MVTSENRKKPPRFGRIGSACTRSRAKNKPVLPWRGSSSHHRCLNTVCQQGSKPPQEKKKIQIPGILNYPILIYLCTFQLYQLQMKVTC